MRGGTVSIRTAEEVAMARRAGHLAADVLGMIAEHIRPGITTDAIDQFRTFDTSLQFQSTGPCSRVESETYTPGRLQLKGWLT